MNRLIQLFLNFFHTYKQRIYKISALALVFLTGCFLSFTTGRRLGQRSLAPVPKPTAISTPSTAETLNGTPHFEFPPSASYSDATPSNADLMSPDILNLAYLYEDGADTTQPSYSYAGRLYDQLSGMDAKWSSGIYDLYHYTPERLAGLLGLPVETVTAPSGVIPEFKNVNLQFLDGDGQASGSTSNARSIVSMANILYYHGILNDMGQLKAYVSDMWEASHSYSVHMGEIYYCDGSCLEQGNVRIYQRTPAPPWSRLLRKIWNQRTLPRHPHRHLKQKRPPGQRSLVAVMDQRLGGRMIMRPPRLPDRLPIMRKLQPHRQTLLPIITARDLVKQ